MSEIEKLLEVDNKNTKIVQRLFMEQGGEILEALEDAAQLFRTFTHVVSQEFKDDLEQKTLRALQKKLGFSTAQEFYDAIMSADQSSPSWDKMQEAKGAIDLYYSRRARSMLLLLACRCYMFTVTDLHRCRGNVALGQLRPAIEAVFFISLIQQDPSIAYGWMKIRGDTEGKKFFHKHKKYLRQFMDKYELADLYNATSGTAQHARFGSVVFGLQFDSYEQRNRKVDEYKLTFQEGEPKQQLLWAIFLLEKQYRLFVAVRDGLPEITDPLLVNTRLPLFKEKINRIWQHVGKFYPEQVERLKKNQNPSVIIQI